MIILISGPKQHLPKDMQQSVPIAVMSNLYTVSIGIQTTLNHPKKSYPRSHTNRQFILFMNGILLPKLFWPTVRNKLFYWSRKTFEIRGWRPRICKIFEITRTIYSSIERSELYFQKMVVKTQVIKSKNAPSYRISTQCSCFPYWCVCISSQSA